MTLSLLPPRPQLVAVLADTRPAARSWPCGLVDPPDPAQPRLDLRPAGAPEVHVSAAEVADLVAAGLPDARAWGTALATTVLEVVTRRRPPLQLSRWLAEDVLAALVLQLPRRRSPAGPPSGPAMLRSVRVQHPAAGVAEVTVHARVASRPLPLALRLEAHGTRWLCTALETGPLP